VICKETKVMGAMTLSMTTFSITTLSINGLVCETQHKQHTAQQWSFFIMLNDVMLSVIMLNVVMLSVVAPKQGQCYKTLTNVFSVCPW
jgi:uncharacterized membrane protein YozB (DUF420 family)